MKASSQSTLASLPVILELGCGRCPTHRRVFQDETFYYWQPGHPLHEDYGRIYFAEAGRWWQVESVARDNADPRYGVGDLCVLLRKRAA